VAAGLSNVAAAGGLLAAVLALLGGLGILYTLIAAVLVGRYRSQPPGDRPDWPAVTVLKPLHGAEPGLASNLKALMTQDYPANVQIVFGIADADDPARAVVEQIKAAHPSREIAVIVDARRHGANNKLSNLINMAPAIRHDVVVVSDSDVALPAEALRQMVTALMTLETGIVSCLHTGRGDAGFWSVLGAMDISYRFLPSIAVGIAAGLAKPCLGPTMALRRADLEAIGGFQRFADVLADDYELGRAIREIGLRSVVPALIITHHCRETSAGEMSRQELRWTSTIRGIDPIGFAGSVVTHPVPLLAMAAAISGLDARALALLGAAVLARLLLKMRVDTLAGYQSGPAYLMPLRDFLSFLLFVRTYFVRMVDWRGATLKLQRHGRIIATGPKS